MGIATKISDDAGVSVNRNPISIPVLKRRGDHWTHGHVFEFPNSLENIANLARFDLELVGVVDVLVGTAATSAEIWARSLHAVRRRMFEIDNFGFSELFLLADDFCQDTFAVDRERNKNGFALIARDSLSAKSNVVDF